MIPPNISKADEYSIRCHRIALQEITDPQSLKLFIKGSSSNLKLEIRRLITDFNAKNNTNFTTLALTKPSVTTPKSDETIRKIKELTDYLIQQLNSYLHKQDKQEVEIFINIFKELSQEIIEKYHLCQQQHTKRQSQWKNEKIKHTNPLKESILTYLNDNIENPHLIYHWVEKIYIKINIRGQRGIKKDDILNFTFRRFFAKDRFLYAPDIKKFLLGEEYSHEIINRFLHTLAKHMLSEGFIPEEVKPN